MHISISGQTEMDKQLALNYFAEGSYDKAILYFEKIYKEDKSNLIFDPYYKSLIEIEDYKSAEKICKKQIKTYPKRNDLLVYLGLIYEKKGDLDKADEIFQDAIKGIGKSTTHTEISKLAKKFESEDKLELALQTYIQANKHAATKSMYNRNLAMIYGRQGKAELMITSLVDIIEEDPRYQVSVQSSLSSAIDFQEDHKKVDLLKKDLLKRSQENPNKAIFNEMLAWMYMLTGNYNGAFIQLKSLDKKELNDGSRVQDLGVTCIKNELYDQAIKCFDYVINLKKKSPYFKESKIYKLAALKKKVLEGGKFTRDELISLKNDYESSIENLGKTNYTISLIRELAFLEGYYLDNPKRGIQLLEETKSIPGVKALTRGEIKTELGDLMVIDNRIWDASLLFMQVEKSFKEDPVGHKAKFKAAQVFYYAGDFEFAQGQLDVLKSSTSKLIANDAMELSMLITDNYNMDTTQTTMKMYATSELLIKQHKYEEANATLDSITDLFGYHSLNDEILWSKSEMAIAQQDYDQAIIYLEEITNTYSDDLLADNAIYQLGEIYLNQKGDKEKAAEFYKQIIFDHQGSLFGVDARKKFREIKPGDSSDNEGSDGFKFIEQPHTEN